MKRLDFLDEIRGLMILWMLIVHISLNYGYITFGVPFSRLSIFSWLSFFMTPFFFFSGYCFKKDTEVTKFLKKKMVSLVLPYFVYTLFGGGIYLVYNYLKNGVIDLSIFYPSLSGMPFYNTPMWFFISLFSVNFAYFFLQKFPNIVVHLVILLCFIVAWRIEGDNSNQILMHRAFPLSLVYFHLGNLMNQYQKLIDTGICLICITGYVIINVLNQQCLWFVNDNLVQGNYLLNLLFSVFAIIGLWYTFKNWIPNNNWLTFSLQHLGRYSLIIFATHRPILNYVYEPLVLYILPNINHLCFTLIGIVFLLLSSFIVFKLFRKISPKLVGS